MKFPKHFDYWFAPASFLFCWLCWVTDPGSRHSWIIEWMMYLQAANVMLWAVGHAMCNICRFRNRQPSRRIFASNDSAPYRSPVDNPYQSPNPF